jgi:hypothetical protein
MKLFLILFMLISIEKAISQTTKIVDSGDFGRYGDCTTGRGICGIGVDDLNTKSTTSNFLIEKKNDSVLLMKVSKMKLTAEQEIALLGKQSNEFEAKEKKFFILEEDIFLDFIVISTLKLNKACASLQKGIFPIIEYQNYYLIELKLN